MIDHQPTKEEVELDRLQAMIIELQLIHRRLDYFESVMKEQIKVNQAIIRILEHKES